nr:Nif3-like dinuclear metal center hexameric protein [Gracilibacillus halotolerans]
MTSVNHVIKLMERWAPKTLAEEWDNVGLLVGNKSQKVKKIMVTLDVLESVVDEAIEKSVDLIIAHHPLIFPKISQINFSTPKGRVLEKLIKNDISVYVTHTNLDIANGGVNDMMANALQLQQIKPLVPKFSEKLYKLSIFVPKSHVEQLRVALGNAGAGHIGNYSHCTFQTEGTGSFLPLEGTTPYLGEQGKIEHVSEYKIETIVKENDLDKVITTANNAHPYEEMAYDIYPLENKGTTHGLGRIGKSLQEMRLSEYVEVVKEALDIPFVRFTGDKDKIVKKVAVLGGSGKSYIPYAISGGADVYITGDLTFHEAQDAQQDGLALIDPGHYAEKIMKKGVKEYFDNNKDKLSDEVEIILSEISTDPFIYQ